MTSASRYLFCALIAGSLVACGDDDDAETDAGPAPPPPPADAGTTDSGPRDTGPSDAGSPDAGPAPSACADVSRVYATTSAFMNPMAESAVIDLESREVRVGAMPSADQDHVAVRAGCRVFELLRTTSVVELRDATDPLVIERSWSLADGGLGNPQDVAWISDDKAYVALLARDEIVVLDPTRDAVRGTIDLSAFRREEDTDGHVEASALAVVGDRAYAVLGRYVIGFPSMFPVPATVAVIDTTTDSVIDVDPASPGVQGIDLSVQNPVSLFHDAPRDRLIVAGPGNYGVRDEGGLEAIDLESMRASGLIVDEAAVGGADVTAFRADGEMAFVVTSDDSFVTRVHRYSLGEDDLSLDEVGVTSTPVVIAARDELWVGLFDGVQIHRASTGEPLLEMPLAVGSFAPYSLIAIP